MALFLVVNDPSCRVRNADRFCDEHSRGPPCGPCKRPDEPSMSPQRILVIEDDKAIRRGLVDALRFESFHVFEADNAKERRMTWP